MRVAPILRAGHGPAKAPFKFKSEFRTPKTSYVPYIPDPAWEKWANMKKDYYKGFKFGKKNIFFLVCINIIMPASIILVNNWEQTRNYDNTAIEGMIFAKADRKPEDLWTNRALMEYKIYDEPPIKISTWKD